jgi:tRNA modification GTPase
VCVFVSDSSDKASIDFTTSLSKDYITNPSSHLRRIRSEIHPDDDFDTDGLEEECSVETTKNQRFVFIRNKIDLLSSVKSSQNDHSSVEASHLYDYFNKSNGSAMVSHFDVSCSKNIGISDFEEGIGKIVKSILESNTNGDEDRDSGGGSSSSISKGDGVIITRVRHRQHLTLCSVHLESFLQTDRLLDLRAEDLRLAMLELGRITGKVDVEELLDVIFRDFCIGK